VTSHHDVFFKSFLNKKLKKFMTNDFKTDDGGGDKEIEIKLVLTSDQMYSFVPKLAGTPCTLSPFHANK
jgi:hypothetical protein